MSRTPPLDPGYSRTLLNPDPDAQHIVDEVTAFLRSCDHIDAGRCADGLETFALAVFLRDEILEYGIQYHSKLIARSNAGSWQDLWRIRCFQPTSRWLTPSSVGVALAARGRRGRVA